MSFRVFRARCGCLFFDRREGAPSANANSNLGEKCLVFLLKHFLKLHCKVYKNAPAWSKHRCLQSMFWTKCSKILIAFVAPMCAATWSDSSKYLRILMIRWWGCRHVHLAVSKIIKDPHHRQQEVASGPTLGFMSKPCMAAMTMPIHECGKVLPGNKKLKRRKSVQVVSDCQHNNELPQWGFGFTVERTLNFQKQSKNWYHYTNYLICLTK